VTGQFFCHQTPLELSRSATVKGARKGDFVAAGDGSLLFLRWPQSRREGTETIGPRPGGAGRLCPSSFRCWCPGGVPVPLLLHPGGNGGSVEVVLPWWSCCTGGGRRRLVVPRRR